MKKLYYNEMVWTTFRRQELFNKNIHKTDAKHGSKQEWISLEEKIPD